MKPTIRDRLINALAAKGWNRVTNAKTTKYVVLQNSKVTNKSFYYIGPKGALRIGTSIHNSKPADAVRALLLLDTE